jgi:CYTH domain-containing protein
MIEIERRFLCLSLEDEALRHAERTTIRQGYLTEGEPAVRIRQMGGAYLLTIKSGRGLKRHEIELPVEPAAGEALMAMVGERKLEKVRCRIGRWEIDLFQGKLHGLVLAEVELEHEEEPLPPPPPGVHLGREVTDERTFTNQHLAMLDDEAAHRLLEGVRAGRF